jgi:ribosomal protein S27AE
MVKIDFINFYKLEKKFKSKQNVCPKCGCQIYSPFADGRLIHDINTCKGVYKKIEI